MQSLGDLWPAGKQCHLMLKLESQSTTLLNPRSISDIINHHLKNPTDNKTIKKILKTSIDGETKNTP